MFVRRTKRLTTDDCLAFDASRLLGAGIFHAEPGTLCSADWPANDTYSSLGRIVFTLVTDDNGQLFLGVLQGYLSALMGQQAISKQTVEIVTTNCHFGGHRFWFLCPLTKNGVPCKRRVRVLYWHSDAPFFGCRSCHDLTYESSQTHDKRVYALAKLPIDQRMLALTSGTVRQRLLCKWLKKAAPTVKGRTKAAPKGLSSNPFPHSCSASRTTALELMNSPGTNHSR